MSFKRARSRQQKDMRLKEIADAAIALYDKSGYEGITLAAIAGKLSFTRANLYKYIRTKEEIFLHVVLSDMESFTADAQETFKKRGAISVSEFSALWAKMLLRHKRLIELMSILYTVIEKNVDTQKLAEFKLSLTLLLKALHEAIHFALPEYTEQELTAFTYMQLYYVMGMYPASMPDENQLKAIKLSGIPYTPPDFEADLSMFIAIALNGVKSKSKQ